MCWAIRDYNDETYPQWIWRHIKTVLLLQNHHEDGNLPVCGICRCKIKIEYKDMGLKNHMIIEEEVS